MKTFYQLEKARRRAIRRWSGFRNAAGYSYRGMVWWIPQECFMGSVCVQKAVNYFLDKMMEHKRKGGSNDI